MLQLEKTYQGWSWKRTSRHVLYWLAWLLFYSIAGSTHSDISPLSWVWLELQIMCVKLPFTYFLIYYLVPNYLIPKKYLQFFGALLFFAAIGGIVIWALYYFIFNPRFFGSYSDAFWNIKISKVS